MHISVILQGEVPYGPLVGAAADLGISWLRYPHVLHQKIYCRALSAQDLEYFIDGGEKRYVENGIHDTDPVMQLKPYDSIACGLTNLFVMISSRP